MRHRAADLTSLLHEGRWWFQRVGQHPATLPDLRGKAFPVLRSTRHMKVILSDNRQKSKCLPLMSLSYFPQEPVLSPEARPRAHLDNCIIIFCLQKGPRMLLSTVKSQIYVTLLPLSQCWWHSRADLVHTIPCSHVWHSTSRSMYLFMGQPQ